MILCKDMLTCSQTSSQQLCVALRETRQADSKICMKDTKDQEN